MKRLLQHVLYITVIIITFPYNHLTLYYYNVCLYIYALDMLCQIL